jgi:hypothetical protein
LKSKFISVIVSVAVILGLMAVPAVMSPPIVSAQATIGIEVVPSVTAVKPGNTFTVGIWVNDTAAAPMFGWDVYLMFNPAVLNVISVSTPAALPAPNNAAPSVNPRPPDEPPPGLLPWWSNATGIVHHGYTCAAMTANVSSSFWMTNITFKAVAPGFSPLNFIVVDPAHQTDIIDLGGVDHLNWAWVVNGTVISAIPRLAVDVTPTLMPGLAAGGFGIGYNITWDMGIPVDYDFVVVLPNATFPNITAWDWGEVLILAAADIVPGWEFNTTTNYTPPIGTMLPGAHVIEWPPSSGNMVTIYPAAFGMDAPWKNTTCPFRMKSPEVGVNVSSLSFECFEGTPPGDKYLDIYNAGGGALIWSATDDAGGWLSENPSAGVVNTSGIVEHDTVAVSVNVTGLSAGNYAANITISGSSSVNVSVDLWVKPATAVDSFRHILPNTTYSGHPGETDEVYPGEVINIFVNFTAPPTSPANGFNAIGLHDLAPDGWTVTVDKSWSWINGVQSDAYAVDVSSDNVAEIMWTGPFATGTNISGMYKVTVPTTADPGLNTWPLCGNPDADDAWLEYYFNAEGPYSNCISNDWQVVVTQPGDIVGETRDVNAAELADVDVQLFLHTAGYLRNDISSPEYVNTAWVTGDYWMVSNRSRYYDINITDPVMLPGIDFDIDLSDQAKLSAGYTFDFEGNFGLVPRACTLSYVLKSVNLWKIGYPGHSEYNLTEWKVGDVINSWLYPS